MFKKLRLAFRRCMKEISEGFNKAEARMRNTN